MRKIREVMRLRYGHQQTTRDIGISCSIGSSTVAEYLKRASNAGLTWPLPESLDDAALEQLLFPAAVDHFLIEAGKQCGSVCHRFSGCG